MAKTPIGEPIPVGDPSSLIETPQLDGVTADNPAATIESLRSDILSADSMPATAGELEAPLPATEPSDGNGWFDLMQMSWQVALMPAMAWTSYLTTAWKAWENSLQPQWPTR